jgi:hypothetical protein
MLARHCEACSVGYPRRNGDRVYARQYHPYYVLNLGALDAPAAGPYDSLLEFSMTPLGFACLFGLVIFCSMFILGWRVTGARGNGARFGEPAHLPSDHWFLITARKLLQVRSWLQVVTARRQSTVIDISDFQIRKSAPQAQLLYSRNLRLTDQEGAFFAMPVVAVRLPALSCGPGVENPTLPCASEAIRVNPSPLFSKAQNAAR